MIGIIVYKIRLLLIAGIASSETSSACPLFTRFKDRTINVKWAISNAAAVATTTAAMMSRILYDDAF
jgi:hypothetical protein